MKYAFTNGKEETKSYSTALEALENASGSTLIVDNNGTVHKIYATELLGEFARKQALINVHKIYRYISKEEKDDILNWLNTGDEQYREAAWSAAWSAAESAPWSAAWEVALEVALSSAESASWLASWSAAESASVAESVARSAAESAAESAARSAARSAAESASAARSASNKRLEEMILKEINRRCIKSHKRKHP